MKEEIEEGRRTTEVIIPCNPVYKKRPRFAKGRAYDIQGIDKAFYQRCVGNSIVAHSGCLILDLEFGMKMPESWSRRKRAVMHGMPHTVKPDLDNLIKFMDVFNGILWDDDARIYKIEAVKVWHDTPNTKIRVESFS